MFSPPARRVSLLVHVAVSVGWMGAAAAYVTMGVVAVTSTVATPVTGIVQSLGTPCGLFRHHRVVISTSTWPAGVGDLFHAIAGLVVLAVPLTRKVVKPRGLTTYGWRCQQTSSRP